MVMVTRSARRLGPASTLRDKLAELEQGSNARAIAVELHDLETGLEFQYRSDRWFHAASTIKLAVLLGLFAAIHRGKLLPQSRLHVRNRLAVRV